ncbi:hypothetical protein Asi03nite_02320 [Actinoplanes siamensis]|uniref:Uncharacterized protein n=1 Tax=Actinoplanes siamensis TaxID=1223317 RepID=A0A919KC64_9ACTN|nr:hypothetical protein Asi03nite_02320 [Actinoplanes siamensis]
MAVTLLGLHRVVRPGRADRVDDEAFAGDVHVRDDVVDVRLGGADPQGVAAFQLQPPGALGQAGDEVAGREEISVHHRPG